MQGLPSSTPVRGPPRQSRRSCYRPSPYSPTAGGRGRAGRRQEAAARAQGPELLVPDGPARPTQAGPEASAVGVMPGRSHRVCSCGGRQVSGTEVYFQEPTVGLCPPSPTLCPLGAHSQGLSTGGQEVETSLSHSPFTLFLS